MLAALLAVLVLAGAGAASADAPFRAADRVTDRAAVLDAAQAARVADAIEQLRAANGTDLFVVYVDSFDGADGQRWADQAATLSQLGTNDILMAVAVSDRVYGVSIDDNFAQSEATTGKILSDDVEPALAGGDWSGAAVALADGLHGGGGAGSAAGVAVAVVGGVVVVGGGAYLLTRRRRRKPEATPTPVHARDEFSDVPTDDLAYRASAALIEVDDAVRTSEQELSAARGHFGDEAVAGFAAALEQSRADMLGAFEIRQQLDDDQPDDEPAKRAMYTGILRACATADDRLDAQVEAFDRLRSLEATAPAYVAGLGTRLDAVVARLPQADAAWAVLQARYSAAAVEPVAGHLAQARTLLAAAATETAEARTELAGAGAAVAVVSGRAAEDAITQVETLLDAVTRRDGELADAAGRYPQARAEVEQDLAEAQALPESPAPLVARAEAALASAERATAAPDPINALRLLDEAGTALDQALTEGRQAVDRDRRAGAALDQTLLTARSAVAAAEDFVGTRRGAVGAPARTRLAEAQRHLQLASGGGDPVAALAEAQQADALAQEALGLAQSDVDSWSRPSRGGGLGSELGGLVLGGILSGALGGGGYRGGGHRGGGFGGGGRSPGSFGGTSSRGRRGGGGRF